MNHFMCNLLSKWFVQYNLDTCTTLLVCIKSAFISVVHVQTTKQKSQKAYEYKAHRLFEQSVISNHPICIYYHLLYFD